MSSVYLFDFGAEAPTKVTETDHRFAAGLHPAAMQRLAAQPTWEEFNYRAKAYFRYRAAWRRERRRAA